MKPERLKPVGKLVVNCEQRRDQRAIRLIARERAEGCRVMEEEWNVRQLANGGVVYDRVPVVHVEAIVKMVRIGCENGGDQQRTAKTSDGFFAHHVRPWLQTANEIVVKDPVDTIMLHCTV